MPKLEEGGEVMGDLIVVKKVRPGDKVRPRESIRVRLLPEEEYTVVAVEFGGRWTHSDIGDAHHPFHDLDCKGCGDYIDQQFLTLEGMESNMHFGSRLFELPETILCSIEALREILGADALRAMRFTS